MINTTFLIIHYMTSTDFNKLVQQVYGREFDCALELQLDYGQSKLFRYIAGDVTLMDEEEIKLFRENESYYCSTSILIRDLMHKGELLAGIILIEVV